MTMGQTGMGDMGEMGMPVPQNSIPMVGGDGPFGYIDMGGMFTVLKVRERHHELRRSGLVRAPGGHVSRRSDGGRARARRYFHRLRTTHKDPRACPLQWGTSVRAWSPHWHAVFAGRQGMPKHDATDLDEKQTGFDRCDPNCDAGPRESGPPREAGGTTGRRRTLEHGQASRTGGQTGGVPANPDDQAQARNVPPSGLTPARLPTPARRTCAGVSARRENLSAVAHHFYAPAGGVFEARLPRAA